MEGRYPEASEVFHCAFSEKWDQNYDNWPDNWTRRRGPRYPRYIPIEMIAEATPAGKHCLRIELDGAGAVAYSPPIPISSLYEYVLEGLVRTQGLEHDRAWLSLTFLDADQEELDHHPSVKVRDTLGWQKLRLGPVAAKGDRARFVLIGLHLEPGARADLKGSARFDDLWLGRLPRIALTTGSELQLFTAKEVPLTCHASGFTGHDVAVKCFLEDVHGTILATQEQRLEVGVAEIGIPSVSKAASPSEESPPLVGTALATADPRAGVLPDLRHDARALIALPPAVPGPGRAHPAASERRKPVRLDAPQRRRRVAAADPDRVDQPGGHRVGQVPGLVR